MKPRVRQLAAARAFWVTLAFAGFVLLLNVLKPQTLPGVCVVGDVRARLAGQIPETLRAVWLDAERIGVGLGTASVEGWEGLGDALVVAGQTYVASTRQDTPSVPVLDRSLPARSTSSIPGLVVHDRLFQTSNLVYVPPGARARDFLQVEPGLTLDALWGRLAARFPDGVLVSGTVHWQRLQRYAMTRPPIDGLSLFEHTTHYYTQPMETVADVSTYLVGIAAHPRAMPTGNRLYAKLFARRPDGRLDLPAQVLVLKTRPEDPTRAPTADEALSVGRAASGSVLAGGLLALYPLENIAACEEAFVSAARGAPASP
jgi:hypothetical protein